MVETVPAGELAGEVVVADAVVVAPELCAVTVDDVVAVLGLAVALVCVGAVFGVVVLGVPVAPAPAGLVVPDVLGCVLVVGHRGAVRLDRAVVVRCEVVAVRAVVAVWLLAAAD